MWRDLILFLLQQTYCNQPMFIEAHRLAEFNLEEQMFLLFWI